METALDEQNSDSSDYDDELIYKTLKKIKPYKLRDTDNYVERYTTTTEFPRPPRAPIDSNLPDYMADNIESCRPNPEWDTVYNPVPEIQVHKLEWTLDNLLIFAPIVMLRKKSRISQQMQLRLERLMLH